MICKQCMCNIYKYIKNYLKRDIYIEKKKKKKFKYPKKFN